MSSQAPAGLGLALEALPRNLQVGLLSWQAHPPGQLEGGASACSSWLRAGLHLQAGLESTQGGEHGAQAVPEGGLCCGFGHWWPFPGFTWFIWECSQSGTFSDRSCLGFSDTEPFLSSLLGVCSCRTAVCLCSLLYLHSFFFFFFLFPEHSALHKERI